MGAAEDGAGAAEEAGASEGAACEGCVGAIDSAAEGATSVEGTDTGATAVRVMRRGVVISIKADMTSASGVEGMVDMKDIDQRGRFKREKRDERREGMVVRLRVQRIAARQDAYEGSIIRRDRLSRGEG